MVVNSRAAEISVTAIAAGALMLNAGNGVFRGRLTLFLRSVTRENDGSRFWFAVCLSSMLAAFVLATNFAAKNQLDNFWLPLIAAAALIYVALDGIVNGTVPLGYRNVTRSEGLVKFWIGVCFYALGGIACLVLLVSGLL